MNIEAYQTQVEWLRARKSGIGASEMAAVMGEDEFTTPLQVYAGKISAEVEVQAPSEAAEIGNILEGLVARMYCERSRRRVETEQKWTLRRHPQHRFLIASLDATVIDKSDGRGPGVLECKTSAGESWGVWRDGVPLRYEVQLQHQLAVTGRRWGAVAVFFTDKRQFKFYEYDRNDDFIGVLVARGAEFWKHVEERRPPREDYRDVAALQALYKLKEGEVVDLDGSAEVISRAAEIAGELKLYRQVVRQLEADYDDAKASILAAMKGAQIGRINGQTVVEIRQVGAFDVPARHQEAQQRMYLKNIED
jgi:putative phage-type endonuclease